MRDERAREIRAAKTIFYVSGWSPRPWAFAAAHSCWFHGGCGWHLQLCDCVCRSPGEPVVGRRLARERCGARGRTSYTDGRGVGGGVFCRDGCFLVASASLEPAGHQNNRQRHDRLRHCDWLTRPRSIFFGRPTVWTARDCYSTVHSAAGAVKIYNLEQNL